MKTLSQVGMLGLGLMLIGTRANGGVYGFRSLLHSKALSYCASSLVSGAEVDFFSQHAEVIEKIRKDPENVSLRTDFARSLILKGESLGEFIEAQVNAQEAFQGLNRNLHNRPEREKWRKILDDSERLEKKLLQTRGREWIGSLIEVVDDSEISFRWGFIDSIRIAPENFLSHAKTIERLAPLIRSLTIKQFPQNERTTLSQLEQILEHPLVARLKELSLDGLSLGPKAATTIAGAHTLQGLEVLTLKGDVWERDPIGDAGCANLAHSTNFSNLKKLSLARQNISEVGLTLLLESNRFPQLEKLHLNQNKISSGKPLVSGPINLPRLRQLQLGQNELWETELRRIIFSPWYERLAIGLFGNPYSLQSRFINGDPTDEIIMKFRRERELELGRRLKTPSEE